MKHLKFPRHFTGYIYKEHCQPGPALGKHFHLTQGLNYAHRRLVENNLILVQVQSALLKKDGIKHLLKCFPRFWLQWCVTWLCTHYRLTVLRAVEHLRTGTEKHLSWAKLQVELGKQKQTDSWPRFARRPLLRDRSTVIRKTVSASLAPRLCQWPPVDPEGPHLLCDTSEKSMHGAKSFTNS